MSYDLTQLLGALDLLGFSSLTDFFLANPAVTIWGAAEKLSQESGGFAPIDIERLLREECIVRGDFHFFARVTLFTALVNKGRGWNDQHYLAGGFWSGMLGADIKGSAVRAWRYLETLGLPRGWFPKDIFDSVVEQAIEKLFEKPVAGDAEPQ